MGASRNYCAGLFSIAITFSVLVLSQPSAAITAELAKKCREMAFKAHPPATIGSKTTSAKAQQEYYKACIAKNGKMD
jgi:hypothetical protein